MSFAAFLLVLGAALAHATWNLAAKRSSAGGLAFVWLAGLVATVLYAPVALFFAGPISRAALVAMALSALFHLGYLLLLQRGYTVGDLSVVYPSARGTGPLLSVVAAILLLGDRPTALALAGAGLVVVGIVIIGTGGTRRGIPAADDSAPLVDGPPLGLPGRRLAGVGYGLAAGVLIAGYTIVDAAAVNAFAITPILFDWTSNTMRLVLLTPYAAYRWTRIREVWRLHRREVLVVAALGPLGYILVLYAFTLAPVSLVAPARELSVVVGVLFGWWLLREPQGVRRLVGATIVAAGVAALALS